MLRKDSLPKYSDGVYQHSPLVFYLLHMESVTARHT